MKTKLVFIILILSISSCNKYVNEELLLICKSTDDSLRIDYSHSMYKLHSVKSFLKNDTLLLDISLSIFKHETFEVKLDKDIKYICTGKNVYEISNVVKCTDIYSGEEALKYIEGLKEK